MLLQVTNEREAWPRSDHTPARLHPTFFACLTVCRGIRCESGYELLQSYLHVSCFFRLHNRELRDEVSVYLCICVSANSAELNLQRWDEFQTAWSYAWARSKINGVIEQDPVGASFSPNLPYPHGGYGPSTDQLATVIHSANGISTNAYGHGGTIQWISGASTHPHLGAIMVAEAFSETNIPNPAPNPVPNVHVYGGYPDVYGRAIGKTRARAWYKVNPNVHTNHGPYNLDADVRFQVHPVFLWVC